MEKKTIWIINHYAVPPELGSLVRHYYFVKNLKEKYNFEIFTSSSIHNTKIEIKEDKKSVVSKSYGGVKYNFIKNTMYSGNGFSRIWNMLQFALKIPFISSKKFMKPDIVYLSSPCIISTFFGVVLGKIKKTKIISEVRDIWPFSIADYSKKITQKNIIIKFLSVIEKYIYKNSDAIIFTMPGGKEYIVDRKWQNKINIKKIFYINNGVDLKEFKKSIDFIDDIDLNSSVKKYIYIGSMRKANDILRLVKIFSKLEKEDLLLLYGTGDEVPKIIDFILTNNIKNIKYKGRVPKSEIPRILNKADVNILMYLYVEDSLVEKYGSSQNKLFEYLASEKLIISNRRYGKYDILESNNCGIVKSCKTDEDYEELLKISKNLSVEEYEKIIDNTKKTIKEYDWKNLSEKLEKVFKYVLEGGK